MMVATSRRGIPIDEFARTIADIAQALESPKDADARIEYVLALTRALVPYDRCAMLRRNPGSHPAVIHVPANEPGEESRAAFLESLLLYMDGELPESRRFRSAAHLAVPVIGCDEIIGVLLLERDSGEEFEAHHLRCLTAIASQLGSYLVLVRLQEESAQTARFREEFIGVIGHDLRNPVAAIVTGAHALLKRDALPPADASIVARMASSAQRVSRMIEDLSDFTRGRLGGGIAITREAANLRDICSRVIEEFQIARPGCSILVRANGDVGGNWDTERLAQVLSNLLGNALDHGTPGAPVRIELAGDEAGVTMQIVNSGRTISPQDLRELFEPFRRGRASKASSHRGLGLGLYIVERIVAAHGGTVSAHSDPTDGTRFSVTLPRSA
jgi:signal transduction histidine kinase